MKKGIHPAYHKDVEVSCICGATFTVNATVAGPIKVETCYQCHPAFNKNKEVKKVVKGMMEKYLEKQKKIEEAQKKAA
ncbi:MAG: 50S ribosomal protein L31 [Candidatus Absconditabacteria bacterium]|nr:50S ribosomal protein L31 [Candidatus Absconditabacteria bacterium]MDD3868119.1 50S ribosomal protein L31 [Candidatus Absconditabacteria bacterium]MDD4714505.1 50S ribosomal protein L31 [Candidatus Absconditabacteria bacterium]